MLCGEEIEEGVSGNAKNSQRVISVVRERNDDVLPWLLQWALRVKLEVA